MYIPFKDKTRFIPVEEKSRKPIFKRYLVDENFKKLVDEEKMSPLFKVVNDGALALTESWAAFGKTIYNPDGTEDNKLKITNYTYDKPVTRIEWSDGTATKVSCNPDEADQWTGFLACIAKRFLGNDVIKEWEKYTITIPAQKKAEEERKAEEGRIAAKKKAKHDKWVARCEKIRKARELARQYEEEQERKEIEKIAIKKFGVPESYFAK